MTNLLEKKEKGFTLIEIVLVLAIAGLLLVIVFLAVSGAQKSRRDSQRKNDGARLMAQFESYASNNGGAYPTTAAQMSTYLPTNFTDPSSGATYTVAPGGTATTPPAGCDSTPGSMAWSVSGRTVTMWTCLEQGSQKLTNN